MLKKSEVILNAGKPKPMTKEEIINALQETIKEVETMPKAEFIKKFNEVNSPCEHCGCNPKNGGSGLCNCTLACPKIT